MRDTAKQKKLCFGLCFFSTVVVEFYLLRKPIGVIFSARVKRSKRCWTVHRQIDTAPCRALNFDLLVPETQFCCCTEIYSKNSYYILLRLPSPPRILILTLIALLLRFIIRDSLIVF